MAAGIRAGRDYSGMQEVIQPILLPWNARGRNWSLRLKTLTTGIDIKVCRKSPNSPFICFFKKNNPYTRPPSMYLRKTTKISFNCFIRIAKIWKSSWEFHVNHSAPHQLCTQSQLWMCQRTEETRIPHPGRGNDSSKDELGLRVVLTTMLWISTHQQEITVFRVIVQLLLLGDILGTPSNPPGRTEWRTRWFFPKSCVQQGKAGNITFLPEKNSAMQANGKRKFHSSFDYNS